MPKRSLSENHLNGLIQMTISLTWMGIHAVSLYNYHFNPALYIYRTPDWALIVNIIGGLMALIVSIRCYTSRIDIHRGYFHSTGLIGAFWLLQLIIQIIM